jgi:hypothetical protein
MPERLVDIQNGARVLHTFPVTISDRSDASGEEAYRKKALEAAANAALVTAKELQSLSAHMHVSRSGALEPSPDPLGVLAETRQGLDQLVREHAFLLWEQAGRPEGRADDFWCLAQQQRWSERAYALWQRQGCPEGKAQEHWYSTLDFERR